MNSVLSLSLCCNTIHKAQSTYKQKIQQPLRRNTRIHRNWTVGRKLFRVFTNFFFSVYSFYSHFYTCTLCTFFNENIYMLDTSLIKMKRMRQQKWTNILLRVNRSISDVWWNMRRSCTNGNLCIFLGSICAGSCVWVCVCIYAPLCSNENRRIEMDDAGPIFVCHCCHYFWASCKQLLYHIWHLVSIPYAKVVYK